MAAKYSYVKGATIDGLIRGAILFFLNEFIISQHIAPPYVVLWVATIACVAISVGEFCWIMCSLNNKLLSFYVVGQCVFALSIILIFVNYMTLGLHIFPTRNLGNGDGILIVLFNGMYLITSGLLRLGVLFILSLLRQKTD